MIDVGAAIRWKHLDLLKRYLLVGIWIDVSSDRCVFGNKMGASGGVRKSQLSDFRIDVIDAIRWKLRSLSGGTW